MSDNKPKFITIFTDASYCQHTGAMGWAGWVKYGDGITVRIAGKGLAKSSHHAELQALIKTGEAVIERGIPCMGAIIVIQSDCVGALDRYKHPFANAKYVKKKHVKGHNGSGDPRSAVNTWCDHNAYNQMVAKRTMIKEKLGEKDGIR